jgi:hypothetical protein
VPGQAAAPAAAAPAPGQGGGTGQPAAPGQAAPAQGQAAIKDEDILAQFGAKESPDQELARLRRDYGASRTEALRLKKVAEGIQAALEQQGIMAVTDEQGNVTGFAPGAKSATAAELNIDFSKLSESEQSLADTKPQDFINLIVDRAKRVLVRPVATVEKPVADISPEREAAIVDHVASLMQNDGETKQHPNLKANMPMIKQIMSMPGNEALRDFFRRQPDMAIQLLDNRVDGIRAFLTNMAAKAAEAAAKKQREAQGSFVPGPSGGGVPAVTPSAQTPDEIGREWAKRIAASDRL